MKCPDIYQYNDYRKFLKDLYLERKKQFTRYSYARLSKELGLREATYIFLVVRGKRNLSLKAMETIQQAFEWNKQQIKYFQNLVHYDQTKEEEKKAEYQKELDKILGKHRKKLNPDEFDFFAHWYVPAIRELISFKKFVPSLKWISRALIPKIHEDQVEAALKLLERLNLVEKKKGTWIQTEEHLATDPETKSYLVTQYHNQMLKLAMRASTLPIDERDITSMTIGLSPRQFKRLKQRLTDFRYELQNEIDEQHDDSEIVTQLNIQLFPIARAPSKK